MARTIAKATKQDPGTPKRKPPSLKVEADKNNRLEIEIDGKPMPGAVFLS